MQPLLGPGKSLRGYLVDSFNCQKGFQKTLGYSPAKALWIQCTHNWIYRKRHVSDMRVWPFLRLEVNASLHSGLHHLGNAVFGDCGDMISCRFGDCGDVISCGNGACQVSFQGPATHRGGATPVQTVNHSSKSQWNGNVFVRCFVY